MGTLPMGGVPVSVCRIGGGIARVCACVWVRMGGACLCVVCGRVWPCVVPCGRGVAVAVGYVVLWWRSWPCAVVLAVVGSACVWAGNDSRVVWFVNLGVSWLRFVMLSVVGSGFVSDISY